MTVRAEDVSGQPTVAICLNTGNNEHVANARAIAALPDLIAVCQAVVFAESLMSYDEDELFDLVEKAKAVLVALDSTKEENTC